MRKRREFVLSEEDSARLTGILGKTADTPAAAPASRRRLWRAVVAMLAIAVALLLLGLAYRGLL